MVHPIEIIDGQHRLWALEEPEEGQGTLWDDDFRNEIEKIEIPVVAFDGLDRTWQAYLFYTINQLPKKVDPSLVYDLYPLLRDQEWLERIEGPEVYRNSRAQDLTMILWSHTESPWKDRILRHGGRASGMVTQASFIRSLIYSFIKTYDSKRPVGGLFGAFHGTHQKELDWSREQQAAFLIMVWQQMRVAVTSSKSQWAEALRTLLREREPNSKELMSAPFSGPDTLLGADQGCRVTQMIMNDVFKTYHDKDFIDLGKFLWVRSSQHADEESVSDALKSLSKQVPESVKLAKEIANSLATFDWRTSSAVPKADPNYDRQASFRGSSGYRSLRGYALQHLQQNTSGKLKETAGELIETLKYEVPE